MNVSYESWLNQLAARGGKGVVNNIDAVSLGKVSDQIRDMRKEIESLHHEKAVLAAKVDQYMELIMAVAQKFPGETRHQTALRYIRERESAVTQGPAKEE